MKYKITIAFKIEPALLAWVRKQAAVNDLTVSEWLRRLIDREKQGIKRDDKSS